MASEEIIKKSAFAAKRLCVNFLAGSTEVYCSRFKAKEDQFEVSKLFDKSGHNDYKHMVFRG